MYKCRRCGEVFRVPGEHENSEFVQINMDWYLKHSQLTYEGYAVRYHMAEEYAEDPHIGISDFIGYDVFTVSEELDNLGE